MAVPLHRLVDVEIQNAKWFYFIVSFAVILQGREQHNFLGARHLRYPPHPILLHVSSPAPKLTNAQSAATLTSTKSFLYPTLRKPIMAPFPALWGGENHEPVATVWERQ